MDNGFEINVSYSSFKDTVSSKKLWWQYVEQTDRYDIFAIDANLKYNTVVWKDPIPAGLDEEDEQANRTDFLTNYEPGSNRPLAFSPSAYMSYFEGKQIDIPLNSGSGYCEWQFETDNYIRRFLPIPIDAVWGDYIELAVLMPTEGDPVELMEYGKAIYFCGNFSSIWYDGMGLGLLYAGLIVRCTYTAADTTGRKFIIHAEFEI